ncbi:MAG: hypothetical protein U9Q81_16080 [Pseudomonadota bacterium]|nr:hypothetical protein [Pseudomonadota bacterium]
MKRRAIAGATAAALVMGVTLGVSYAGTASAESARDWGPIRASRAALCKDRRGAAEGGLRQLPHGQRDRYGLQ